MAKHILKLTIEGMPEDNGDIRASDFAKQIQSIISVFNEIDHEVTQAASASMYLRVIDLRHGSPATVIMEAVPKKIEEDQRDAVFAYLADTFKDIEIEAKIENINYSLLETLQEFVEPIGKTVASVRVAANNNVVDITQVLKARIDEIMAKEEMYSGELTGVLEYINVHGGTRKFRIYPDIGPSYVTCNFLDELTDIAVRSIRGRVEVSGVIKQKKAAPFPHEIDVEKMELFPSDDELPRLSDLRGIAPDATGSLKSEEFIWNIRGELE